MKHLIKITAALLVIAIVFTSCKRDDYLIGGTLHNPKVNATTYDYLKSNSMGLFDTLLLLVDKAGVKEKINKAGISFFAPTDYAITNYLNKRVKEEQNIDPNRKWTIDSMIRYELPKFADSIDTYIINEALTYDKLTGNGAIYPTQKAGINSVVSYEETRDPNLGYNPNVSTIPRIVYYTMLLQPLTPPIVASEITSDEGVRTRVQTSGIETNTGILHVLNNGHSLFFRK